MLKEIKSSLPTFKTLTFKPGLNVLLAERTIKTSSKRTRNGAGKTGLIELVHFLFGARSLKLFKVEALKEHNFSVIFDHADTEYTIERCDRSKLPFNFNNKKLGTEALNDQLGELFFKLNTNSAYNIKRFAPSFRMLFPYFVRNNNEGGFDASNQVTKYSKYQQPYQEQVGLSYLLGLDWNISIDFQEFRAHRKSIADLKKAFKDFANKEELDYFSYISSSKLRTEIILQEQELEDLKNNIDSFNVVPQYQEMQNEADDLTIQTSSLNLQIVQDQEMIKALQDSLVEEEPIPAQDIINLYNEAEVILSDLVKQRFEDVEVFHKAIIENRKEHLQSEINSTQSRIDDNQNKLTEIANRRQKIMNILQEGGALQEFSRLQEELNQKITSLQKLKQQLQLSEDVEKGERDLDQDKMRLEGELQLDLKERKAIVSKAILYFGQISKEFYEHAGSFVIEPTPNGLEFTTDISNARSKGVGNMQIFCFDMMLTLIALERGIHPGFLIHDSHLFDGVDERQVAKALQIGANLADKYGFQYIVTMNSDAVPDGELKRLGFDLIPYIIDVTLTDQPDGGLFGFKFSV
ncbi:DUF2326 domain-containing protein [Commensalibacter oyaizuii]|uniref:DUF2326 domain-containing protein n=1 Tax=Commensalibacter oyaizuii TaxID=3043873 RepID=A0ABT6Q3H2_9PROT|nr:DUF2326 domain-containing protein [Commensalibacter sp. TBRC 16381]MDI2091647.1 DUF2326 domain-containing protein [Commensalibacter sp. TBRC 16381]